MSQQVLETRGVGESRADALLTAAAWALPSAFILVPLLLFLVLGFFEVEGTDISYRLTLKNYVRFFTDAGFIPTFLNTCWLGLKVSAITVFLGYPVAFLLAGLRGRAKYTATMFLQCRC
jgi:spermidine/putrescine transport system permease protein